MKNTTIAAIATAPGNAGISIIRISGSEAINIASHIFVGKRDIKKVKSHTILYGNVINPKTKTIIDEIMISKMQAPNTYTREDIIEINCHGGYQSTKKILQLVFKEGAEPAEPGEFTKRAFLNGRIDLSQAEAVMDIINSKTDKSLQTAVSQLEGYLSKELEKLKKELIELLSHIEVTLDYPEYDDEKITEKRVIEVLDNIKVYVKDYIKSYDEGKILKEGLKITITGKPNVGKSSLLNALSGNEKAIVTNIPGTTRDVIEEEINIDGIPIILTDTAGIRNTTDLVEEIGIKRAEEAVNKADLIISLLDFDNIHEEDDKAFIEKIESTNIPNIICVNKTDLSTNEAKNRIENILCEKDYLTISVDKNIGIIELRELVKKKVHLGTVNINDRFLITNVRHKNLLEMALSNIEEAESALSMGLTLDMAAVDIKNAVINIGEILGQEVSEEIISNIFKNFCVGK